MGGDNMVLVNFLNEPINGKYLTKDEIDGKLVKLSWDKDNNYTIDIKEKNIWACIDAIFTYIFNSFFYSTNSTYSLKDMCLRFSLYNDADFSQISDRNTKISLNEIRNYILKKFIKKNGEIILKEEKKDIIRNIIISDSDNFPVDPISIVRYSVNTNPKELVCVLTRKGKLKTNTAKNNISKFTRIIKSIRQEYRLTTTDNYLDKLSEELQKASNIDHKQFSSN